MSSPATPSEIEAQGVIPIEKIKGPFVHRASNNGTPAEGPYRYCLDWTKVHLGLYRHLALPKPLDHHALFKMAQDLRRDLSGAFPSEEVYQTDIYAALFGPEARFDMEDGQTMSFLSEQLRYFEWETSQWTLFQASRQNHLDEDLSRPELCRAYYRWLIDSLGDAGELVKSEPLRINNILQRKLAMNLKGRYPELSNERMPPHPNTTSQAPTDTPARPPSSPALAPAAPAATASHPPDAPQPRGTPAALFTPDRGKNQSNVNSLHGAIASPEPVPEPNPQQPLRPAKRKRAACALARELRSLTQLGGPGNALVGRAVVIAPDNADEQEPQENAADVTEWGRRLRRRLNGRVVSQER